MASTRKRISSKRKPKQQKDVIKPPATSSRRGFFKGVGAVAATLTLLQRAHADAWLDLVRSDEATGGSSGSNCSCEPCASSDGDFLILTQTIATAPSNRSRLTIGICEVVNLWTELEDPNGLTEWCMVSCPGKGASLSVTNGAVNTFTAPEEAADITIKARFPNGSGGYMESCVTFHVIVPTGIVEATFLDLTGTFPLSPAVFNTGFAGITAYNLYYLQPASVSFSNIQFQERQSQSFASAPTGIFAGFGPMDGDSGWIQVFGPTDDYSGSKIANVDTVGSVSAYPGSAIPPFPQSDITYTIPMWYNPPSGHAKQFGTVDQTFSLTPEEAMSASKAGWSGTTGYIP